MNTVESIINFARQRASLHKLPSSEMGDAKELYDIYLKDLLEERNWIWSIGITSEVTETRDGTNLGYSKKYRLGVEAEDVLAINYNRVNLQLLDIKEALDYGYASDPVGEVIGDSGGDNSFAFINGVLHTNADVEKVIYKRLPDPRAMKMSFKLLLANKLALHFASEPGADVERAKFLKRELITIHVRAARDDAQKPKDTQLLEVYYFIKSLKTESNLRY